VTQTSETTSVHYSRPERMVGISLMGSDETEAAIEVLRRDMPGVEIDSRDCYYKIERPEYLCFDMNELSEELGRDTPTNIFLVNMATYYGRIVVSDDRVELFADALPDALRPR
jgi:propane monooxygenase coupling protein